MTTQIIWNEEIIDTTKTIKYFKDDGLLTKGVIETAEKKAVEKNINLDMLLDTTYASLLGNLWTDKGVKKSKISGGGVMRAGEGAVIASQDC